ncbi:hypothetical protein HZS_4463, partial [Henneguya salminicola]
MEEDNFSLESILNQTTEIDSLYLKRIRSEKLNRISQLKPEIFEYHGTTFDYFKDGNPDGPVILTLHDIGQNSSVAFGEYFSGTITLPILKEFCIYHITLPGQLDPTRALTSYPSFDEMAKAIIEFINFLKSYYIIGFGIGAGANILIRACLFDKKIFSRLILINGYANSMGWGEWLSQKYHTYDISETGLTPNLISHLIDHFFGQKEPRDLSFELYNGYLGDIKNSSNLKLLLDSAASRTAINLIKSEPSKQN